MAPSILQSFAAMTVLLSALSTATPIKAPVKRQGASASTSACTNGNNAVICGAQGDSAGSITVTQADGSTLVIAGPSGTNPGYVSTIGGAGPTGAGPTVPLTTGTTATTMNEVTKPIDDSTGAKFYPIQASVEDSTKNVVNNGPADVNSVGAVPLSTGSPPPASTLQTTTIPTTTSTPGGTPGGTQGSSGGFGTNFASAKSPMTCPVTSAEGQKGYLAPGGSSSGSCQGESNWCTGDLTFYEVASDAAHPSACGDVNGLTGVNSDSDFVIAVPINFMNKQSMCGKTVQIHNPASGQSATATVVDSCGDCQGRSIDMSHGLYDKLVGNRDCGRVGGVQWYFG
ncbi:MAG: hypothetical protein Q9160_004436 [Pyrenula sp. 1 TL-2023]